MQVEPVTHHLPVFLYMNPSRFRELPAGPLLETTLTSNFVSSIYNPTEYRPCQQWRSRITGSPMGVLSLELQRGLEFALQSMSSAFPAYHSEPCDEFASEVHAAIRKLDALKPPPDGPAYLGDSPQPPDYRKVTDARLAEKPQSLDQVVDQSVSLFLFDGLMNLAHPLTMPNVIPPANKAGIIAAMMTNVFIPNMIEGEYGWNVQKAEMESSAMLADLIGWEPTVAGGLYTYGGSGCYLYGLKYALTQVLGRESRNTGIRTDGKLLVSQQGHYTKLNSTDWTGLGMNNIVEVELDEDTNAMDLEDLEAKLRHYHEQGIPIISVVCTMGTTDAFAIDHVSKVRALLDEYPNRRPYGPAFLYCDAVIGWSFLTFNDYNFGTNPLGFSKPVLEKIASNLHLMQTMRYADAVGIDFHKTGWAPYNSSLFMIKDLIHFRSLLSRPCSAYLQERTAYNPGLYTLEASRSGSYAMAGWATLKFFGAQGFQSMLGGILEVQDYLRKRLSEEKELICVNEAEQGFVTLFRVYPSGVVAAQQFEAEMTSRKELKQLKRHNALQRQVADVLWGWLRRGERVDETHAPNISYTSGFRATDYNSGLDDEGAVVYALKSFPMNVNITARHMETLIRLVKKARDEAIRNYTPPMLVEKLVSAPYDLTTVPAMKPMKMGPQDRAVIVRGRTARNGTLSAGRKRRERRHKGSGLAAVQLVGIVCSMAACVLSMVTAGKRKSL